ncbi:MAG: hypothetical protein OHK0053_28820 [Microscillaceae bacterium]
MAFLKDYADQASPPAAVEISPGVVAHWLPKGNTFYPPLALWMCSRMRGALPSQAQAYMEEKFYRLAVEHSSNFILLLNRDFSLLYASPSVGQAFGLLPHKMRGQSLKILLDEEEFERLQAASVPLWEQKKERVALELQARSQDGKTRWLAINLVRLHTQSKPLDFLMLSARDVSLQKKYEVDLTLQRNHYQYLFDHNPSPLLIVSQESFTILKVNQTAQQLYGYPPANFVGKDLASFCPPSEQARFVAWMKEDKRGFFAISPDFIHQRQDQSHFYVNVRGHYFEYEDQPAYLLLITDVSQRLESAHRIQKLLDNEQSINEELRASEEMLRQSLEELKTLNDQRKYDADFKSILLEIFVQFINLDYTELDQRMDELLVRVTEFSGFDRARLILFHKDGVQAFVRYEYAAPHLPPPHSSTQNFLIAQFPWWTQQLRRNEMVAVPSLDALPPEAENERKVMEINHSQSAYAFPMLYQQKLMGYIVFLAVDRPLFLIPESAHILKLMAYILANIFQRAEMDEKLRQNEQLYRMLADNTTDIVSLHEVETEFIYATPSIFSVLGYPPEALQGQKASDFVHPEDADYLIEKAREAQTSPVQFLHRFLHKDGYYVWMETSARAFTSLQGETKLVAVTRDVGERVHTQALLEENRTFLQLMFEESTSAIFVVDNQHHIVDCNRRAMELFEADSKQELLGRLGYSFEVEAQQLPNFAELTKALSLKAVNNRQVKYKSLKGKLFWGNFEARAITWQSQQVYLVTVTDITALKEAEVQIESLLKEAVKLNQKLQTQNQELRQANEELDRFVYSVSHDLRAPLTSAMGLIEVCMDENQLDTIKEYLALQNKSLRKLDEFIHEIVHYSRNSRTQIVPKAIDFHQLIEGVLERLQFTENSPQVRKIIEIVSAPVFYSDAHRLEIILSNLISNAIRYADLEKADPYLKVKVQPEASGMCLEVSDNGLGIGEEHQQRIFEMFYRATHQHSGSGLGLYILQEAVRKIQGSVELRSTLGAGSVFTVHLPDLSLPQPSPSQ